MYVQSNVLCVFQQRVLAATKCVCVTEACASHHPESLSPLKMQRYCLME